MNARQCIYGDHRARCTFCRHPEIAKPQGVRAVSNRQCLNCPLYDDVHALAAMPPLGESTLCVHRQREVRTVPCKVCSGHRELSILGCDRHGACTPDSYEWELLRENGVKIKSCRDCPDLAHPKLSQLAIIATHFNPLAYDAPSRNLNLFLPQFEHRERLELIELEFGEPTGLTETTIPGDKEKHFLFQKEALINAASKALPASIRYVCWVDADLIFSNSHWPIHAMQLLDSGFHAVQCFSDVEYLGPEGQTQRNQRGGVHGFLRGEQALGNPGMAWMMKRADFDAIGGLDPYNITGNGDITFFAAVSEYPHWSVHFDAPSAAFCQQQQRYIAHAKEILTGRVGYVPGTTVKHLWHGSLDDRRYYERTSLLQNFDPQQDVIINDDGLLEWTGNNPQLQQRLRDYFSARREDDPNPNPDPDMADWPQQKRQHQLTPGV